MPNESTYQQPTTCPHCGASQDLHTNTTGARPPKDGDVAICWRCHGIAVYAAGPFGVVRRKPTEQEDAQIRRDPCTRHVLTVMARARGPEAGR
jgi:hypothetical protein